MSPIRGASGKTTRHPLTASLLKRWRYDRGLSLHALADKSGVPHSTISRFENKLHEPGVTYALRIAKALRLSVKTVFGDWI